MKHSPSSQTTASVLLILSSESQPLDTGVVESVITETNGHLVVITRIVGFKVVQATVARIPDQALARTTEVCMSETRRGEVVRNSKEGLSHAAMSSTCWILGQTL